MMTVLMGMISLNLQTPKAMITSYCTTTNECFTAKNGQNVRFEDFLKGIDRKVQSFVNKGLSREDAEDLFQDAVLKMLRSKQGYDPTMGHRCPQAYGARIAVNCSKDAYNKRDKHGTTLPISSIEVEDEDGEVKLPQEVAMALAEASRSDDAIQSDEAMAYIREAMDSLNERYRKVLRLHLMGLKPQKMAKVLGCDPSVASLTLFRARKALWKALGDEFLSEYGLCA